MKYNTFTLLTNTMYDEGIQDWFVITFTLYFRELRCVEEYKKP